MARTSAHANQGGKKPPSLAQNPAAAAAILRVLGRLLRLAMQFRLTRQDLFPPATAQSRLPWPVTLFPNRL